MLTKGGDAVRGIGTPAWTAPEWLNGDTPKYNAECDIYSFAVILWELAARQTPWKDLNSPMLIFGRVIGGKREVIPTDTPRILASLISRCWDGRADQRPTIDVVVQELEAHQQEAHL